MNALDIRPMYYSEIFIDPSNEEHRVYALATSSNKSEDGGRTFEEFAVRPTYDVGVHADHHAFWIDPNDPNHLYLGGDAGLHESYDKGLTFRKINNFPIAQFYAIGVDMRDPYWVYGGLQDNHSFAGPSRTRRWERDRERRLEAGRLRRRHVLAAGSDDHAFRLRDFQRRRLLPDRLRHGRYAGHRTRAPGR